MKDNLSPEEILKYKEEEGGLIYDEHPAEKIKEIPSKNPLVERIQNEIDQKKGLGNINNQASTQDKEMLIEKSANSGIHSNIPQNQSSLGRVDNRIRRQEAELEIGWKNLPLDMLPSLGLYYPEGTQIAIRHATVSEIRHFSTIDEDDKISMTSQLNFILDRCMRIQFPKIGVVDYLDLIQEDRFYIIIAIRDLTFIKGENKIILKPNKKCDSKNGCPFDNGFELRSGCLNFFTIKEEIMKYYSTTNRRFEFRLKDNPDDLLIMNIPTIGTKEKIAEFLEVMQNRKIEIDNAFKEILPFILPDRKYINTDLIYQKYRESDYWSKEEFSLYFMLAKELKIGTKLDASLMCPNCNEEVSARILFKNGIKSIFVISDILGKLL